MCVWFYFHLIYSSRMINDMLFLFSFLFFLSGNRGFQKLSIWPHEEATKLRIDRASKEFKEETWVRRGRSWISGMWEVTGTGQRDKPKGRRLTHQEVELAQKVNFLSQIKENSKVICLMINIKLRHFGKNIMCPEHNFSRRIWIRFWVRFKCGKNIFKTGYLLGPQAS